MRNVIKKLLSAEMRELLNNATAEEVVFVSEVLSLHPDSKEKKIGYCPVMIKNVALPKGIGVTYVRGEDLNGYYWYVVSSINSKDGSLNEYEVNDDLEARRSVLLELKTLVA